jgi:PAS domain S-box-containing protein
VVRGIEGRETDAVRRTAIRETLLFWRRQEEPGRAGEASGTAEGGIRALADVVFDGVAVVEEGGRISEANELFASMFGYEQPEVVGRTLAEFVTPESRGLVEKSVSAGLEEAYEVVGLKRDDTPLNVEIRARPSSYGGRAVHLVAVRDVTGGKEVKGRLSQAGYRALVEQIPAVTYTQEPKAGHHFASLYLSPQAERMLGHALEEFASDPGMWVRLIHPEDRERVLAEGARANESGEQFSAEYRLLTKDGRVVWVCDEATLVSDDEGRPLCWQGVLTDVTGKKQAEEALKESEQRFRSLVQNSLDIITLVEADGTVRYVSPAIERVLGYRPEERVGRNTFELVHPDDVARARRLFAEGLRSPGATSSIGVRMRHRDGSWRHIETKGANRLDDPGVDAVVLNSRDVTERERTEEALKENERRYADLLSSTRAYVYRCLNEPGWPNEFVSDYAIELTGYAPEELLVGGTMRFGDLIVEEDRQKVWDEVQTSLDRRERFKIRYTIRHSDGTPRHVEEYGQGVYDQEGDVEAIEGIVYDVTELKRAEERLREAEERYRALVEQIPAVTYIQKVGQSSQSSYVSPQMETMLGYKPEECTSDPEHWIKIMHPADRERVLAEDARTNESGEPFRMEFRQFAKDGSVVWIRDEAVLVRDEEGAPSYWLGIQYDITERKRAEEALKESELRLRTVISNVPVVLFALDFAGVVTLSEGKGMGALGLEPGEIVGRSISEVFGNVPGILEDVDRALAGETLSAVREVSSRTFEMWYSPVRARTGEVTGAIAVSIDITERKEAEEALKESEERYRLVAKATNEAIWDNDLATGQQSWNGAIEAMFGYSPDEVGDDARWREERIHPDDRERVLSAEEAVLEEGGEGWSNEYRFRRADGDYSTVVDRAYVLRDEGGRPVRLVGSMMDVTERRRAEEALRRSEAGLAEAQRMAHLGNWEWDMVADEVYWSDEVFRIYGFAPKAFVPTLERLLEVVHPDDREALKVAIDGALYRGEPYDFEHRIVRPDGEERVVHRRAEVARDEGGKPIKMVGTVHDITERKRAEEDMKEANRRLEELAVLKADFTAMVAHELDTPLAVIRGYADMLATGELDLDEHSRALDRVQAETDLLEALVSDVRSAAAVEREDFAIEPQQVAVGGLLRDAAAFVETIPGDHRLVTEGAADGWVLADPHRIGQVLRNLLSNAAKYSPDGAPIELRTVPGAAPGHVRIEVADRGAGIHPDDAVRIFEKFGRGRDGGGRKVAGTGLGLYLSRRILQAHGSELTLDSVPGGGSVFGFELRAGR